MEFKLSLNLPSDLVTIFATIGAVIAFVKGVFEYIKQGREKRSLTFFELEKEFFNTDAVKTIIRLLENDDIGLSAVSYEDKVQFLGFLEKVAILCNSRLFTMEIASYVYGYYTIRCADSQNFWTLDLDKESQYWELFFHFAEQMRKIDGVKPDKKKLKF